MNERMSAERLAFLRSCVDDASDGLPLPPYVAELLTELDAVTAERDAARADAARLDWLEETVGDNRIPDQGVTLWSDEEVPEGAVPLFALSDFSYNERGNTLREAIDAAMHSSPSATTPEAPRVA